MWQLSPNDLPTLSRRDRGLLFNYFGARAARLEAAELARALERRELDVSRLTEDQVFEKIVLPMVRSAGIPVDDD